MPNATWQLYGDFFTIEGVGVVILGHGKSKAGRVAAGLPSDAIAATDMLDLARDGSNLICRYVGPRLVGDDEPLRRWKRIDWFANCLLERTTQLNYADRPLEVIEVNSTLFRRAARFSICFPRTINDCAERAAQFSALIDGADIRGYVVIPWLVSHQAKGALLRTFLAERGKALAGQADGH